MSETLFAPITGISPEGRAFYGDDSRLAVRFYRGKQIHGLESQEAGRPIYHGVDMCAIRQPGERDEWHGAATAEHKARFPKQWEAYQNNQEYVPDGTPLSVIFAAEPETVENLRHLKIHTVEQLAGLQENAITRIGLGGRNLVIKAAKFMEAATGYQAASKMNKELEDMKSENETLKEQIQALQRAFDSDREQRRGPGRPRKEEQE
ncbi:MAG: hypothetical protein EBR34_16270 [Sphingomonadaceae bacterium]|nr:hypothetical protein [Sphingomonadaceae bacterium]